MSNLRIVPRNFHDEALLTASSTVLGFEASNTQNSMRSRVWRTVSGANATLDGVWADNIARTPLFFGMFLHHNHGGKIRLQLYSDTAWTTQVYDSTAVDIVNVNSVPTEGADWGYDPFSTGRLDPFIEEAPYWLWIPTSVNAKSYRISLSNHSLVYNRTFWETSRFFLGPYVELESRQPEYGLEMGYVDQTDRNRSRGGSLRTNHGVSWRTMQLNLGAMDEDERAGWLDIFHYCGTGRDFVISLFPGEGSRKERDYILNAKFSTLNAIGRQVNRLSTRLQLEEC